MTDQFSSELPSDLIAEPASGLPSDPTEVRIIYHPAPFPGPDGMPRKPDPINLGGDLELAVAWMRRRLSLYEAPPLTRFIAEIIDVEAPAPMSEPELAEASERAAAAVEAYDAERADRALAELAAELDEPEMYDEDDQPAEDLDDLDDALTGLNDLTDDEARR